MIHCVGNMTGMMLWEGSWWLGSLLMRCPECFMGQSVVELGSGSCPLPSLAASYHGARAVVTDGSMDVLKVAAENIAKNQHKTKCAVVCKQLKWGDEEHIKNVLQSSSEGYAWILGADVLYSLGSVKDFFQTARSLLWKTGASK